jgi:glyoxylase-like metal-dependent hydrolase (beta-lactamase superfamily II)
VTGQPPPTLPAPVVHEVGRGVRVTTLTTGWVRVRTAHRQFAGPDALALPAILAGRRWTPWMPVNVFLVEHPERTVLVDTGEAAHRPPGHFGSAGQERFYRRYLRFDVPPGADPGRQLRTLGVEPRDVDTVLLTHLHSDHTANLGLFDRAGVLVGAGGLSRHPGATHHRLPAGRTRELTARSATTPLTGDGSLRVVSLPGHTPGHQGLLVRGDRTVIIAGDVAFDGDQVRCGHPPGIATDRAANRSTQAALARQVRDGATVLLSHAAAPVVAV